MDRIRRAIKRKRWAGRKGTELIEFSIAAPLFLLMMLGSIDIGWLLFQQIGLQYVARETVRYIVRCKGMEGRDQLPTAGIGASCDAVSKMESLGREFLWNDFVSSNHGITHLLTWPDTRLVKLELSLDYKPLFGKLVPGLDQLLQLKASAVGYYEAFK